MCGICGYVSDKYIEDSVLDKMADTMVHRGPDSRGVFRAYLDSPRIHIGFGHRRLSVIDISDMSNQPMSDETGKYTIVFNGEIYNYIELRDELIEKGHIFKSSGDAEVLLRLYIEYGTDAFKKLNGMFAFAIYDKDDGSVICVRDRIGEKHLYYFYNGHSFVFGSELKALLVYPFFKREINTSVLASYMTLNSVPSPLSIYKNTYKLKPGEWIRYNGGNIEKHIYYDIASEYIQAREFEEHDYISAKNKLKELIYASVVRRLVADVPVGCFLSGGIDSSLIAVVASDILGGDIDTFCIGFDDEKYDESQYAKDIAGLIGTRHHCHIMDDDDMKNLIQEIPKYYDEPFGDSSQLPAMLLCAYTRQNMTVALSGDGGDELFAGYNSHDFMHSVIKGRRMLAPFRILPKSFVSHVADKTGHEALKCVPWDRYSPALFRIEETLRYEYVSSLLLQNISHDVQDSLVPVYDSSISVYENRLIYDMTTYLPDEILVKTDRASMRVSLELRAPLLDPDIISYSHMCPYSFKYRHGDKKHILKDLLYDMIPKGLLDRPKKGFGAPIHKWLNTDLNKMVSLYSDADILKRQGIFNPNGINDLVSKVAKSDKYRYSSLLWNFLIFQQWYRYYIEDLWQDVV